MIRFLLMALCCVSAAPALACGEFRLVDPVLHRTFAMHGETIREGDRELVRLRWVSAFAAELFVDGRKVGSFDTTQIIVRGRQVGVLEGDTLTLGRVKWNISVGTAKSTGPLAWRPFRLLRDDRELITSDVHALCYDSPLALSDEWLETDAGLIEQHLDGGQRLVIQEDEAIRGVRLRVVAWLVWRELLRTP